MVYGYVMVRKKKPSVLRKSNYEIDLKWVGKRKPPYSLESQYGFGSNPPITVSAESISAARRSLRLPKTIKIRKIKKV